MISWQKGWSQSPFYEQVHCRKLLSLVFTHCQHKIGFQVSPVWFAETNTTTISSCLLFLFVFSPADKLAAVLRCSVTGQCRSASKAVVNCNPTRPHSVPTHCLFIVLRSVWKAFWKICTWFPNHDYLWIFIYGMLMDEKNNEDRSREVGSLLSVFKAW